MLGPVHTYPFSFENAHFSLRIRLPSTRIRWKRYPKTQLSENVVIVFQCLRWKPELFENDDVSVLDPAYPHERKWWERVIYVSALHKGWLSLAHKHKHNQPKASENVKTSIKTYASTVSSISTMRSWLTALCLCLCLFHPRSHLTQVWHNHSISTRRTGRVSSCAYAYIVGVLTCFLADYAYSYTCAYARDKTAANICRIAKQFFRTQRCLLEGAQLLRSSKQTCQSYPFYPDFLSTTYSNKA